MSLLFVSFAIPFVASQPPRLLHLRIANMKLATLVAAAGLAALVLLSTSAAALPLEEEDEFDFEDEFVIDDSDAQAPEVVNVQEPQPTAVAQPSAQTIADKESSPAGTPAEVESRSFILEYLGIAAIVVYVVMFLLGKQKNSALARTWYGSFSLLPPPLHEKSSFAFQV